MQPGACACWCGRGHGRGRRRGRGHRTHFGLRRVVLCDVGWCRATPCWAVPLVTVSRVAACLIGVPTPPHPNPPGFAATQLWHKSQRSYPATRMFCWAEEWFAQHPYYGALPALYALTEPELQGGWVRVCVARHGRLQDALCSVRRAGRLWAVCGLSVGRLWAVCGPFVGRLWAVCGPPVSTGAGWIGFGGGLCACVCACVWVVGCGCGCGCVSHVP